MLPQAIKPRSILHLAIAGFLVVSGVLLAALSITIRQLELMSERSQQVVSQSITAMAASRTLLEQASALERNARQYGVVRNDEILQVYEDRRESFRSAALTLEQLRLEPQLESLLTSIRDLEANAYALIRSDPAASIDRHFGELLSAANGISEAVTRWANQQIVAMQTEAAESRNLVLLQTFFLIGAAVLLASVFILLITRPLRQIGKAIDRLGAGAYDGRIDVGGPRDLVTIGQQLDWLRERLANLEQQRTMFLRHVSHELKSPLATIQESTALLGDGVVGTLSDEQHELIDIQSKSLKKLHSLIDDLLRQHERNYAIVKTVTNALRLDQLLNKVCAEHSYSIKNSRLKLRLSLQKCRFTGNREQLRVAFDNLISNAIRFSPQGGTLSIDLFYENENIVLLVQDEGPGIREEERERIFEAFYSGEQVDSQLYKGSGLGLAIAKEYIEAHAGSIDVVSENAHGACFRVILPREQRDQNSGDGLNRDSGELPELDKENPKCATD